jgi:hypothetical protein
MVSEGQPTLGLDTQPADQATEPAPSSTKPAASPTEPLGAPEIVAGPAVEEIPDPASIARQALDRLPGRSPLPEVCPFLRGVGPDELLGQPGSLPDAAHRCAALEETWSPGQLQQELLCLGAAHVTCPRYRRGAAAVPGALEATASGTDVPRSIRLAAAFLALVFVFALVAVVARGGLSVPGFGAGASPTPLAGTVPTPPATPSPTPSPAPSPTASPTPSPTASPTPSPTQASSPTPSSSPTSRPTIVAGTTDPRYAGLQRCPAPQTCYVYIAKSTSTVYSIASYFSTTPNVIRQLNPQIPPDYAIYPGERIKVPPPKG